jgi:hypothetical protein
MPVRDRGGVEVELYTFFTSGLRWDGRSTPRLLPDPPFPSLRLGGQQVVGVEKRLSLAVTGVRIPDRLARSDLLYSLSYPDTTLIFKLVDSTLVLTIRMQCS